MIDVSTGQTLWDHEGTGATRNVNVDPKQAKAAFARGVAEQVVDKAFKTPLEEEARKAAIATLSTLPGYKFCGFAVDEQTPAKAQAATKGLIKDLIKR
jgi:hypothetical protein